MTGNTFEIEVASCDTILDVKRQIQSERSIPSRSQVLLCREKVLHDHEVVEACHLVNGSTLQLVLEMKVGHGIRPKSTGKSTLPDNSVLLLLCKQDNELYVLEVTVKDGRCTEVRAKQLGEHAKWDDLEALQGEAAKDDVVLTSQQNDEMEAEVKRVLKRISRPSSSREEDSSALLSARHRKKQSNLLAQMNVDNGSSESLPYMNHRQYQADIDHDNNIVNTDEEDIKSDCSLDDINFPISSFCSRQGSAQATRSYMTDRVSSAASSEGSVDLETLETELQQLISTAVLSRKPSRPATAIIITRVAVRPLSGVCLQRRAETAQEVQCQPVRLLQQKSPSISSLSSTTLRKYPKTTKNKLSKRHAVNTMNSEIDLEVHGDIPRLSSMAFTTSLSSSTSTHSLTVGTRVLSRCSLRRKSVARVSLAIGRTGTQATPVNHSEPDMIQCSLNTFTSKNNYIEHSTQEPVNVMTNKSQEIDLILSICENEPQANVQISNIETLPLSTIITTTTTTNIPFKSSRTLVSSQQRSATKIISRSAKKSAVVTTSTTTKPRTPNRYCVHCNLRPRLAAIFKCKCGNVFCAAHRFPDMHKCTYDHLTAARSKLVHDNPVVRKDKITKI